MSRNYTQTGSIKAGLPVCLPGLTNREENYVRTQVEITLNADPFSKSIAKNTFLGSRYKAMASSFNMKKPDELILRKICNYKKNNPPLTFYSSLIERILTYHDIDPDCFDIFSKCNNRDHFKAAEEELKNSVAFKQKYRDKLEATIGHLGLEEMTSSIADLDENISFSEFSKSFHKKVIGEYCGISSLETLDGNNLRSGKESFKISNQSCDPINLVRNAYIFDQILNLDLDISLTNVVHLTDHCSLDLLVSLNLIHLIVRPNCDFDIKSSLLSSYGSVCLDLSLEDKRMWFFPVAHAVRVLHKIGFTQDECESLLFTGNFRATLATDIYFHCLRDPETVGYRGDLQMFTETMEKRVKIIRQEGVNLGVVWALQIYQFMMNWEAVMKALSKSSIDLERPHSVMLKFNPIQSQTGKCGVKLISYGGSRISDNSGIFGFLKDMLGCYTMEQGMFLSEELKKIPHFQHVPFKLVVDTAIYLLQEGFTKRQMEVGCHIMVYSHSIIEKYINDAEKILGTDWRQQENALCLLLYRIELETKFSSSQILDGISIYVASSKLSQEIPTEDEDWLLENEDDDLFEDDIDEHMDTNTDDKPSPRNSKASSF